MGAYGSPDLNNKFNSEHQNNNHKFVTCRKCGFVFSNYYKACPRCNTRHLSIKPVFLIILAILFIVISVIIAPLGFVISIVLIKTGKGAIKTIGKISLTISTIIMLLGIFKLSKKLINEAKENVPKTIITQQENQLIDNSDISRTDTNRRKYNFSGNVDADGVLTSWTSMEVTRNYNNHIPKDGNVFVLCEVEIENNSSNYISFSNSSCVTAFFDNYLTNQCSSQIIESTLSLPEQCSIPTGKKIKGYIAFEVQENWQKVELRITPNILGKRQAVFSWPPQ